ncbi:MAG: glycosyltransferase [Sphingobacteriales bacterium]|nr:glycosyltransferase [Sphingobacteriales bacterium]
MIFTIACIFIFTLYAAAMLNYWLAWKHIPVFVRNEKTAPVKISIVVPARNEEKKIDTLLQDLQAQAYPKDLFEIIIVDDHSSDATAEIVKSFPGIKLVQLSGLAINSYKKKAIETGIMVAEKDWIVTTDADCRVGSKWLGNIAGFIEEKKPVFVAAPVMLNCNHSLLQIFQAIDFMVLQGVTGAAIHKKMHSMGNGANLAYERKAFLDVKGFTGIDHIASGDDMLLMHKIERQFPGKTAYLKSKEAIVSTEPMKTWKSFLNQRIRWASKARQFEDKQVYAVLMLVYFFNLLFPVLIIAGFYNYFYWQLLGGFWIGKTLSEWPLVYSTASFFDKQKFLKYFFFFQPLHIAYTILSGFLGQLGRYEWKGRRVK